MISDYVVLVGKDGSITSIYEPVSVFAGGQGFPITKFLRIHDTQEMLLTKPEDRQFASVIKYDHSEGKILYMEMFGGGAIQVCPDEFVHTLFDTMLTSDNPSC